MSSRAFLRLILLALLGLTAIPDTASAQRNYAQEEYVIASGGPALSAYTTITTAYRQRRWACLTARCRS